MVDKFSKNKRSQIMRSVKSSGNLSTELKIIDLFKKLKIIGWRRNYKLPGKPDFVFPKQRIVLFVDGCFWHGHNCRNVKPSSNTKYWRAKIGRNKKRDKKVAETLINKGWQVIRIWECDINN